MKHTGKCKKENCHPSICPNYESCQLEYIRNTIMIEFLKEREYQEEGE